MYANTVRWCGEPEAGRAHGCRPAPRRCRFATPVLTATIARPSIRESLERQAARRLFRSAIGAERNRCRPPTSDDPDYFHKVVDCQWACPAHTPVPEYIRLIAAGRYTDAYMVNWESNVFPGILGRTCDRPCEPACRRGRVEEAQAEQARAGRDLPPEARRRRLQGRHHARACRARRSQERQAHRLRRRRPGLADGRARPRAARLRGHRVRRRRQGRRHDPLADPALSPARGGDRRGGRLHPRPRRRVPRRRSASTRCSALLAEG